MRMFFNHFLGYISGFFQFSSFQVVVSLDYLYALADHYLKRGKLGKARNLAEQMIEKHPDNAIGRDILNFINLQ